MGSSDVNAYLKEITGQEFTAKDFRTWAGTVLASLALQEFEAFDSQAQAKKNLVRAIESVAQRLGNTPSVCRKCYIHPVVLDSYLQGTTVEILREKAEDALSQGLVGLSGAEGAVLAFLRDRLRGAPNGKPALVEALRRSVAQARQAGARRGNAGGAPAGARARRHRSPPSAARRRRA